MFLSSESREDSISAVKNSVFQAHEKLVFEPNHVLRATLTNPYWHDMLCMIDEYEVNMIFLHVADYGVCILCIIT